ncbi:unnamed protein product [Urochloa humidicola]
MLRIRFESSMHGVLKAIWPHSGHYRPTEENFQEFQSFLKDKSVDLTDVKVSKNHILNHLDVYAADEPR